MLIVSIIHLKCLKNNTGVGDDAYDKVKDLPCLIIDDMRSPSEIVMLTKAYVEQGKCDVVVIDYIQNLSTKGFKSKYDMLEQTSHLLQSFAIQYNVCVIVVSQVNRSSIHNGEGGEPKGAGDIAEAADVLIKISRKKDDDSYFGIYIAKNRHGVTGMIDCVADFKKSKVFNSH